MHDKTKKKIKIITGVMITLAGIAWYAGSTGGDDVTSQQTRTTSKQSQTTQEVAVESIQTKPINYKYKMSTEEWTPVVEAGIAQKKSIIWGIARDDVGYIVEINGGAEEGGWQFTTPPRQDRKRLGWEEPSLGRAQEVRFKLAKPVSGVAMINCTVTPLGSTLQLASQ